MSVAMFDSASPAKPVTATRATGVQWTGRILTGIAVLFLTFDVAIKLAGVRAAVEGTVQLGYAPHHVLPIGLILLACLIFYVVPRTAPLGAVLLTGYLGGAIATQLRVDNPLFTHILSPIYIAAFIWGGLYLRDPRVRALLLQPGHVSGLSSRTSEASVGNYSTR